MNTNKTYISLKRAFFTLLRYPVRNRVYTVRHGLAKGLKRSGGLGFLPRVSPMTPEEKWLTDLDLNGCVVYDIGSFEGIFTMFFARAVGPAGKVVTFEPHPRNADKVVENVRLNNFQNVEVRRIALGKESSKAILASRSSETGTASLHDSIQGDILKGRHAETFEVEVDSLDRQVARHNLPAPDLVKIDVEGLEMDVLLGMRETMQAHKPNLFIEIHDYLAEETASLRREVEFLIANGYSVFHVEAGSTVGSPEEIVANAGHLYCTATTRLEENTPPEEPSDL